jgi:hypothetical protein
VVKLNSDDISTLREQIKDFAQYTIDDNGFFACRGKLTEVHITRSKRKGPTRYQTRIAGRLLWSGPSLVHFLKQFWYAEPTAAAPDVSKT